MNREYFEKNNTEISKMPWWQKLCFKLFPKASFRLMAKKIKINNVVFDKLHDVFSKTEKIDIFPAAGNSRGFILVLDRQTALFFYQDGDHFSYDGFEMGEYEKGDVTIFDSLRNK